MISPLSSLNMRPRFAAQYKPESTENKGDGEALLALGTTTTGVGGATTTAAASVTSTSSGSNAFSTRIFASGVGAMLLAVLLGFVGSRSGKTDKTPPS
jgi:hypothetical protein